MRSILIGVDGVDEQREEAGQALTTSDQLFEIRSGIRVYRQFLTSRRETHCFLLQEKKHRGSHDIWQTGI